MSIWTDEVLGQFATDGTKDINQKVPCIFKRRYLIPSTTSNMVTRPNDCISVRQLTWRGIKLDEMAWIDMETLLGAYDGSTFPYPTGRPQFYCFHPVNRNSIILHPGPNEVFTDTGGDPYAPIMDEARLTIEYWAEIDESLPATMPPPYIFRRTIKSYILWQSFQKEGKGQNLKAGAYYKTKYKFLIDFFKKINAGVFVSKRYSLMDDYDQDYYRGKKPASPVLPPNFPRVRFR